MTFTLAFRKAWRLKGQAEPMPHNWDGLISLSKKARLIRTFPNSFPKGVKGSCGSSSQCIDYESNGSDKAVGTGGAGNTLAIEDKGLEEEEKVLVEEAEEAEEEVLVASRDHCVTRSTFV